MKSFLISFVAGVFLIFAYQALRIQSLEHSLVAQKAIQAPPQSESQVQNSRVQVNPTTALERDSITTTQSSAQSSTETLRENEMAKLAELQALRLQLENALNPANREPTEEKNEAELQTKTEALQALKNQLQENQTTEQTLTQNLNQDLASAQILKQQNLSAIDAQIEQAKADIQKAQSSILELNRTNDLYLQQDAQSLQKILSQRNDTIALYRQQKDSINQSASAKDEQLRNQINARLSQFAQNDQNLNAQINLIQSEISQLRSNPHSATAENGVREQLDQVERQITIQQGLIRN